LEVEVAFAGEGVEFCGLSHDLFLGDYHICRNLGALPVLACIHLLAEVEQKEKKCLCLERMTLDSPFSTLE
jgi:hypothetical protein